MGAFGDVLAHLGARLVLGMALAIAVVPLRALLRRGRVIAVGGVLGLAWWVGVRWWVELLAMATVAAATIAAAAKLVELVRDRPGRLGTTEPAPAEPRVVEVVRPFDAGPSRGRRWAVKR